METDRKVTGNDMEKPRTPVSTEASAQPIKGLSKRAQAQLQPRRFSTFSLARPKQSTTPEKANA